MTRSREAVCDMNIGFATCRLMKPVFTLSTHAVFLLLLSLTPTGEAWSAGLRLDPQEACDFLVDERLRTRGGYRQSGNLHRCSSQRRNLGGSGRVQNSIRYIAWGDAEAVTGLRLELRVNSGSSVQRAHRQLVNHGAILIKRALDVEMPEELESAILSATNGSWDIKGSTVSLERIVAGQPGHELRLIIQ